MGDLANKKIGDSYRDLLQVSNLNRGVDNTPRFISDGEGTQSALGLSSNQVMLGGHMIPQTNATFDIGSAEKKIRHLYLSDNSLYVGATQISADDANNIKGLGAGTFAKANDLNILSNVVDSKVDTQQFNDAMVGKASINSIQNLYNELATKPSVDMLAETNNTVALKADKQYVDGALADKADQSAVDGAMAGKAGKLDMDNALAAKADNLDMINRLASHPTHDDMNTALAGKADTTVMLGALLGHPTHVDMANALTDYATNSSIDQKFADVINGAPEALNTLNEIAASLGDDGNYAATVTNQLASKANQADVDTALAAKANQADVDTALNNKADITVMLASLAGHPTHVQLQDALDPYATQLNVNNALAAKADQAAVDTSLAAKANQSDVDTALAAKANQLDVDTALAAKANQSDVDTALAAKANTTDIPNMYISSGVLYIST